MIAKFSTLASHEINDEVLDSLMGLEEGLEAIEELDLKGSRVTSVGLKNLNRLTHLARLDVRGLNLDDSIFNAIGETPSIQELRVDGSTITPNSTQQLQALHNLKVFHADGVQLVPLTWQTFLLGHPELEELICVRSNLSDPLCTTVAKLANLRTLLLSDCGISDLGLAALAPLDNLERLTIVRCPVTGVGFRPAGGSNAFRGLRELNVTATPLNELGAKAISQMTELTMLHIGEMPTMQDQHLIQIIRPLKALEDLDVHRNIGLTSKAFTGVAANQNLRRVRFSDCRQVDDAALRFLSRCKNLEEVILNDSGCSLQGVLALREILPNVQIVGLGE